MIERLIWMAAGVGLFFVLVALFYWFGWIVSILRHGAVAHRVIEDAVRARQSLEDTVRQHARTVMPVVEQFIQSQSNPKV